MRSVFLSTPPECQEQNQTSWRWWLFVWAPVAVAIAVISIESTSTFSAANTSGWLRPILERLFGTVADSRWELLHHYLRKTGHFAGYGTVGFTFLRAWLYTLRIRSTRTLFSWRARSTCLAILSTATVASGDEFHQSFLPSRTGTPVDVLLDSAGATVFCLVIWLVCWGRRLDSGPSQAG